MQIYAFFVILVLFLAIFVVLCADFWLMCGFLGAVFVKLHEIWLRSEKNAVCVKRGSLGK